MAEKSTTPITQIEHIPASEHGTGFPPFNPETFASQLFWLALVFGALYVLMSHIALPRVGGIFAARGQQIEGDFAAAQRLKEESDAVIAAYEQALAGARARAQVLANESREKYAAKAEAARRALDTTLSARIAEAEQVIATRRADGMANVQEVAVETAAAIVERLIGSAPAGGHVAKVVAGVLKR